MFLNPKNENTMKCQPQNKDITNMTKTDEHEHIHGTSRNNVLDFTLAYNVSDWTSGYFGDIGGFIAYFSAPGQGEELR